MADDFDYRNNVVANSNYAWPAPERARASSIATSVLPSSISSVPPWSASALCWSTTRRGAATCTRWPARAPRAWERGCSWAADGSSASAAGVSEDARDSAACADWGNSSLASANLASSAFQHTSAACGILFSTRENAARQYDLSVVCRLNPTAQGRRVRTHQPLVEQTPRPRMGSCFFEQVQQLSV